MKNFNRCPICPRDFKMRKEFVEHVKEHKKKGEGGLFLLVKRTKRNILPKIYFEIFKNPGITSYQLVKKLGIPSGVNRHLVTLEKHKLILRKKELSGGKVVKRNYVNLELLCNFILNWWTEKENYDKYTSKKKLMVLLKSYFYNWEFAGEFREFLRLWLEYEKEFGLNFYDIFFSSIETILANLREVPEEPGKVKHPSLLSYIILLRQILGAISYYLELKDDREKQEDFLDYLNYKFAKKFARIFGDEFLARWKEKRKEVKQRLEEENKVLRELSDKFEKIKELLEEERYEESEEEFENLKKFIEEHSQFFEKFCDKLRSYF
jgi:predicted ArsR family transcriptional regulator